MIQKNKLFILALFVFNIFLLNTSHAVCPSADTCPTGKTNCVRTFIATTGGGVGAMDKVSYECLKNGDPAIVTISAYETCFYRYNSTSASTEAGTGCDATVVKPDDNSGNGRWIRTNFKGLNLEDFDLDQHKNVADMTEATGQILYYNANWKNSQDLRWYDATKTLFLGSGEMQPAIPPVLELSEAGSIKMKARSYGNTAYIDFFNEDNELQFRMGRDDTEDGLIYVAHDFNVVAPAVMRVVSLVGNIPALAVFPSTPGNSKIAINYDAIPTYNLHLNGTTYLNGSVTTTGILYSALNDASNSSVTYPYRLTHTTSGTPATGIGVGMEFEVETSAGNNEVGAVIETVATDVTATSEDFDLVFKTMTAGASASEKMRVKSTGDLVVTGNIESTGRTDSAKYIVFLDGATVKAKNMTTGAVDYSGSALHTVLNSAMSNLTASRTWKEKVAVVGSYTLTGAITIPSYTILEGPAKITGYASGGGAIFIRNSDQTNGNKYIEIIGLTVDGYFRVDGVAQHTGAVHNIGMIAAGGVPASATDPTPTNTGTCTLTLGTTTGIEEWGDYRIEITADATPDVFQWSDDGGVTWVTGVAVTGSAQTLSKGKTVAFSTTTCGLVGDDWSFEPRVVHDVKIKNVTSYNTSSEAIQLNYVSNFEIDGLRCWGVGDDCISSILYSNNGIITNSFIVQGESWTPFGSSGIEIEQGSYELTIANNVITGDAATSSSTSDCIIMVLDSGVSQLGPHDITIANNILQSCRDSGIAINNASTGKQFYNISMTGNIIKNSGGSGISITGLNNEVDVTGISISGGGIYGSGAEGIFTSYIDGLVVSGVSIMESYGNGIDLASSYDVFVSNNFIFNNGNGSSGSGTEYGVMIRGADGGRIKVFNNMIGDNQTSKTQEGIYITTETDNIYFANNDLSTIKTYPANAITNAANGWANTFNNMGQRSITLTAASTAINSYQLEANYVRVDCDFATNCDFTLIEPTGIQDGQTLTIEVTTVDDGYTVTMADQANILDVATTFIMNEGDILELRYSSNSGLWREIGRSDK